MIRFILAVATVLSFVSANAQSDGLQSYGTPNILTMNMECTYESFPKEFLQNQLNYIEENDLPPTFGCPVDDIRYNITYYGDSCRPSDDVAVFVGKIDSENDAYYPMGIAFTNPITSNICNKGRMTLKFTFGKKEILKAIERFNASASDSDKIPEWFFEHKPFRIVNPISTWCPNGTYCGNY